MPSALHVAVIDQSLCTACPICTRDCPTEAIWREVVDKKHVIHVDDSKCVDCTICFTRCPEHAISMELRSEPMHFGIDWTKADPDEVKRICHAAHMHEEQIICFCRQTQARDVAAAILLGHTTPESVSLATGIRTGCGVLCVTAVLRLLKAADIELGEAPGWQWYGSYVTIWDIPPEVRQKYKEYFVEEDYQVAQKFYPSEV